VELGLLLTIGKYLFVALLYAFIAVVFRLLILHIATPQQPVPQHDGHLAQRPVLKRNAGRTPAKPTGPEPQPKEPATERRPVARLLVVETSAANLLAGTSFPLDRSTSIGRNLHNDVNLQDRYVSARHALIIQQGDSFVLHDCHSTNGTIHNGVKIQGAVVLSNGDEITIGTTTLRYQH